MEGQRIDKWLWCARLARTGTLAKALVTAGKIRVNGKRPPKPSRLVHAGDMVTGTRLGKLFVVRAVEGTPRRGSAGIAQRLFEDLTPPIAPDVTAPASSRRPRPTKRDRRRIDTFCAEDR